MYSVIKTYTGISVDDAATIAQRIGGRILNKINYRASEVVIDIKNCCKIRITKEVIEFNNIRSTIVVDRKDSGTPNLVEYVNSSYLIKNTKNPLTKVSTSFRTTDLVYSTRGMDIIMAINAFKKVVTPSRLTRDDASGSVVLLKYDNDELVTDSPMMVVKITNGEIVLENNFIDNSLFGYNTRLPFNNSNTPAMLRKINDMAAVLKTVVCCK